jgi:hypothetical protein
MRRNKISEVPVTMHMETSRLLTACVTVRKKNRSVELLLQLVEGLSYEQLYKIIIILYLFSDHVANSVNILSLLLTT